MPFALLRWTLLTPAVVAGFFAVAGLYALCHHLLLQLCPPPYRFMEGVTDLSTTHAGVVASACSAIWYAPTEVGLMLGMLMLAVGVGAAVGYVMAPRRKSLVAALCVVATSFALALLFVLPGI